MAQLGDRIFNENHMPELYYASAFAHYKLEFFWRNAQIGPESKPGRWQILMAARHLAIGHEIGAFNSREAARNANRLCEMLWTDTTAVSLFMRAINVVFAATEGAWERDRMRNEPTTQDVLHALGSAGRP